MKFFTGFWLGQIFGSKNNDGINWKEKKEILEREKKIEKEKKRKAKEELKEKIVFFLKENFAKKNKCVICKGDDFTIDFKDTRHIKCFKEYPLGYEVYSLRCDNCGNTHFLNKSILENSALNFKPKKTRKKRTNKKNENK